MTRRRRSKKNYNLQSKSKPIYRETSEKIVKSKRKIKILVPVILIGIFFLVLFFNSYFNYTSGIAFNPEGDTIGTRFFLSGPDPYYNMRLCQITLETGEYPFVSMTDSDPLLNYPAGVYGGARPPLFNMIAVGATNLVEGITGINQMDALGWCMLFLPAIYGALLVFPVYGIGKELFNKKVGLISAMFVALIPIHLAGGHGSALSLFDHDSFVLLLFACTFYFVIKSLKQKSIKKTFLYSILGGIVVASIQMTWVAAQTLFLLLILYLIVQLILDIFKSQVSDLSKPITIATILGVGFLISFPYNVIINQAFTSYMFYTFMMSLGLLFIYIILKKLKLPWLISIPSLGIIAGIGLTYLYAVSRYIIPAPGSLEELAITIFGEGIYGKQVSLTIGEAHTYGISQSVMSFGPALYWVALAGFVIYIYYTYRAKLPSENMFFIVVFFVQFWMTTIAGRFLNDLIPAFCVFAGFILYVAIKKANFNQMIKNIKSIGGFKGLRKGIKLTHWIVILCLTFLVIIPNTYLSMDAAVPPQMKEEVFGEGHQGSFGLYLGQQVYWADACHWLSQQDTDILVNADKPGIISWWDYGFYIVSMSEHPTVADNYQEGLECAGNFHTSQSEEEATTVLIVRLVEGVKTPKRLPVATVPDNVKNVFIDYLGEENGTKINNILENPIKYAPTYDTLISPEYGNTFLKVDAYNSMYHDARDVLLTLDDYTLTKLYHELIDVTGYQIRYYGIEYRDLMEIFGVFPFLADKGTHGYASMEDDWFYTQYYDINSDKYYTVSQLDNLTREEVEGMDLVPATERKETYFNSMAYKTYFGITDNGQIPDNRAPTYFLKHWKPSYVSPYVVIAKYYEGANITGTVKVNNIGYDGATVYVFDEFGIPHDYDIVEGGQFNVISFPGNMTLRLFMQTEFLDEISIGEVTEDEATWKTESNHTANFVVDFANVDINVSGVNETLKLELQGLFYGQEIRKQDTLENIIYNFDDLAPSHYKIVVYNSTNDIIKYDEIFLRPGDNQYNLIIGE